MMHKVCQDVSSLEYVLGSLSHISGALTKGTVFPYLSLLSLQLLTQCQQRAGGEWKACLFKVLSE